MPQTLTAKKIRKETVPVPPPLRRRLWYGVIGAGLFMAAAYLEGWQRTDYDVWQQSISALSLSPRGWVQTVNFFVFGAIILSTVPAWRKLLAGGTGSKACPVLTALTGISLIICGFIPQDPAPGYDPQNLALAKPTLGGLLHLLFAAIGALSAIIGLLVMARRFTGDPLWYGWNAYSVLMAIAMTAFITIYAIWSTASTGYAGAFERLGAITVPVWVLTFLIRLEAGVPFMHRQQLPGS